MEVVVTTGVIRRAKLQSKYHRQQTNTQFFTGPMPFLSPNHQCQSTERGKFHVFIAIEDIQQCRLSRSHFSATSAVLLLGMSMLMLSQ